MSRPRPLSFVARFALTSGALLAVAGLALSQLLSDLIVERAHEQAVQTGVVAVRLGVAPNLGVDDLGQVAAPQAVDALDRAMGTADEELDPRLEAQYDPLRLKIFNPDGMIVYSDKHDLMGKSFDSEDLDRSLAGEVLSQTTVLQEIDERTGDGSERALEVYVPLYDGGPEPVGVAEIYLPYDPVARAITEDTRALHLALAVTLLAFYLLMSHMVARASARLRDGAARNDYLAHHDTLTGLPNRALLLERLERALVSARRRRTEVGVLLIDLDRFKEVNDTLGHETGDLLLEQVGRRIADELRSIDTVARLGGDEFVIVLPDVDGARGAALVADRLLDALHRPFDVGGVGLAVEASIGIACFPEHGTDQGLLLQHADVAMYVAKQARGTHAVYDADSDVSSLARITLLNDLRTALDGEELVLHYQPKEELVDGTVRSVEALVRWEHPTRGLVPPDEFVPVAEQTGLVSALTTRVLSQALRQARAWQDEGRDIRVAVNLSARNLLDAGLPDLVAGLLRREGVAPERLEVEVTETSAMTDPVRAGEVLQELSRLGVAVTVDDYGTGYSSLSYLRSLPIGTLKIDRSFVSGMLTDEGDAVIVRSTVELAHSLGLRVVAEGVEDRATYDALAALGCQAVQGYYLSRPQPAAALAPLLDERRPFDPAATTVA